MAVVSSSGKKTAARRFIREVLSTAGQKKLLGAGFLAIGSNLFFFIAAWVIGDVARRSRLRADTREDRLIDKPAAEHALAPRESIPPPLLRS